MPDLYSILKASRLNPVAAPDGMTAIWAKHLMSKGGGYSQLTLTGVPPFEFYSNGDPIISLSMLGNTQQTGTPSPQSIVMPTFCGVRTANLFDESTIEVGGLDRDTGEEVINSTRRRSGFIDVTASTRYSISRVIDASSKSNFWILGYDSNKQAISDGTITYPTVVASMGESTGSVTFTTTATTKYIRWYVTLAGSYDDIMLNTGSTAQPYEPYGWAEKITCAEQTNTVYLGQTQTVRKIGKLVLTGEETIAGSVVSGGWIVTNLPINTVNTTGAITAICSHYKAVSNAAMTDLTTGDMCISTNSTNRINFATDISTAADFKAYLAAQYAAGTPVTVWYVLATPTTAIVNEPLAKIGDYADELNIEAASVTIPTSEGVNTLTVDVDLQPSSATIAYRGWVINSMVDVPPITFLSKGKPLVSLSMLGNTQQTGTPSPGNIIMPTFCGVRTANLFDKNNDALLIPQTNLGTAGVWTYYDGVGVCIRVPCQSSTTYTISGYVDGSTVFRVSTVNTSDVPNAGARTIQTYDIIRENTVRTATFTTPNDAQYLIIQANSAVVSEYINVLMLNTGSTALPYEPYGWAEKITCAGQTTPVYLGQVQTVRRIKKLVLTGGETIGTITASDQLLFRFDSAYTNNKLIGNALDTLLCNVYKIVNGRNTAAEAENNYSMTTYNTTNDNRLVVHDDRYSTTADFKAYLAAQYAAGTPVVVWYVLAEPTTGIINEPLAKIGDYADELHSEDTTVSIPTAKGQNTLSAETDLQPSSISIKYV